MAERILAGVTAMVLMTLAASAPRAEVTTEEAMREQATALMDAFAERTGLAGAGEPRRYLWTDAFALYTWLDLHRETGDARYRERAERLIEQVHGTLGRHRPDDPRTGWLSGLPENEGARHPTAGGLRIGKALPERQPDEPIDERLEWDRDGQYFHYLTKWMDALARAAALLGEPLYRDQAVELAEATFPRFLRRSPSGEPLGLAWKMSIDLSRPLVLAMSPHDALDGYVTFRWLQSGSATPDAPLAAEVETLRALSSGRDWATADPLGIGGLLLDAFRLAILPDRTEADERVVAAVLAGADAGLEHVLRQRSLDAPASRRLGFRELGLAIGLQTLPAIAAAAERSASLGRAVRPHLESLMANADAGERIVAFWSDPANRDTALWRDHRDINDVMLAAALARAYPATAVLPDGRGGG